MDKPPDEPNVGRGRGRGRGRATPTDVPGQPSNEPPPVGLSHGAGGIGIAASIHGPSNVVSASSQSTASAQLAASQSTSASQLTTVAASAQPGPSSSLPMAAQAAAAAPAAPQTVVHHLDFSKLPVAEQSAVRPSRFNKAFSAQFQRRNTHWMNTERVEKNGLEFKMTASNQCPLGCEGRQNITVSTDKQLSAIYEHVFTSHKHAQKIRDNAAEFKKNPCGRMLDESDNLKFACEYLQPPALATGVSKWQRVEGFEPGYGDVHHRHATRGLLDQYRVTVTSAAKEELCIRLEHLVATPGTLYALRDDRDDTIFDSTTVGTFSGWQDFKLQPRQSRNFTIRLYGHRQEARKAAAGAALFTKEEERSDSRIALVFLTRTSNNATEKPSSFCVGIDRPSIKDCDYPVVSAEDLRKFQKRLLDGFDTNIAIVGTKTSHLPRIDYQLGAGPKLPSRLKFPPSPTVMQLETYLSHFAGELPMLDTQEFSMRLHLERVTHENVLKKAIQQYEGEEAYQRLNLLVPAGNFKIHFYKAQQRVLIGPRALPPTSIVRIKKTDLPDNIKVKDKVEIGEPFLVAKQTEVERFCRERDAPGPRRAVRPLQVYAVFPFDVDGADNDILCETSNGLIHHLCTSESENLFCAMPYYDRKLAMSVLARLHEYEYAEGKSFSVPADTRYRITANHLPDFKPERTLPIICENDYKRHAEMAARAKYWPVEDQKDMLKRARLMVREYRYWNDPNFKGTPKFLWVNRELLCLSEADSKRLFEMIHAVRFPEAYFDIIEGPPGSFKSTELAEVMVHWSLSKVSAQTDSELAWQRVAFGVSTMHNAVLNLLEKLEVYGNAGVFDVDALGEEKGIPFWYIRPLMVYSYKRLQAGEANGKPHSNWKAAERSANLDAQGYMPSCDPRSPDFFKDAKDRHCCMALMTCGTMALNFAPRFEFNGNTIEPIGLAIDEASRATFADLIPVVAPMPRTPTILSGDNMQLRPYMMANVNQRWKLEQFEKVQKQETLPAPQNIRYPTDQYPFAVLTDELPKQHRLLTKVAARNPKDLFDVVYSNYRAQGVICTRTVANANLELKQSLSRMKEHLSADIENFTVGICRMPNNLESWRTKTGSLINAHEGVVVEKLCHILQADCGVDLHKDLIVLPPYNAQRTYLEKLLSVDATRGPTVATIDAALGGERALVILSLTRTSNILVYDPKSHVATAIANPAAFQAAVNDPRLQTGERPDLGFLDDVHRMIVGCSRPRSKLFIIGEKAMFPLLPIMEDFVPGRNCYELPPALFGVGH